MKLRPFLLVLILVSPVWADGSDFQKRAQESLAANDQKTFTAVLSEWKAAEPKSPEPYIAEANRLFGLASAVTLSAGTPEKGDFDLKDPKTGKSVGRVGNSGGPDAALSSQAVGVLRKASELAPDRLDIRMGMAFLCQESGQYDAQLEILTAMVKRTKENPDGQRWKAGEALNSPVAEFVAEKLHSYALYHYKKETPEADNRFGTLCRLMVEEYPESPVSWNDMALFHYFAEKNVKAATGDLEKAAEIDPDDRVVQFNLAKFYTELKETAKARAIYQSIISKSKDGDAVRDAKSKLDTLNEGTPAAKQGKEDF